MNWQGLLLFLILTCCVASASAGTTIVSDTFGDGDVSDGTDALDVAWQAHEHAPCALSIASDPTIGDGNAMVITRTGPVEGTSGNYTAALAKAQRVSLDTVGSFVRYSYDFHLNSPAQFGEEQTLRIGLFDSERDGAGYFAMLATTGVAATDQPAIYYDQLAANAGGPSTLLNPQGRGKVIRDTDKHTASILVVRIDPDAVKITVTCDDVTNAVVHGRPDMVTAFDQFIIRGGTTLPVDLTADNVLVETGVVPEPGTFGVFLSAGLGLACMRRSRA